MRRVSFSKIAASSANSARTSGAEAYELLLSGIEEGTLPPGIRLREAELAERFNLSRTPVREALKRLEMQGLVAHEPHRGAIVAALDYSQVTELYLLREVLEGTAARLAAQHATEVEIGLLQDMVARDRTISGDPRRLARSNRLFHQQLRESARNRYVNQALETLRLSLALLSGTTLGAPGRGAAAVEEHAAIVARIAARDTDGAEQAARQHIRAAFRTGSKPSSTSAPVAERGLDTGWPVNWYPTGYKNSWIPADVL